MVSPLAGGLPLASPSWVSTPGAGVVAGVGVAGVGVAGVDVIGVVGMNERSVSTDLNN